MQQTSITLCLCGRKRNGEQFSGGSGRDFRRNQWPIWHGQCDRSTGFIQLSVTTTKESRERNESVRTTWMMPLPRLWPPSGQSDTTHVPILKSLRRAEVTYHYDIINSLPTAPIILASLCSAVSANSHRLFWFFSGTQKDYRLVRSGDDTHKPVGDQGENWARPKRWRVFSSVKRSNSWADTPRISARQRAVSTT
jgi:hypothetical protein